MYRPPKISQLAIGYFGLVAAPFCFIACHMSPFFGPIILFFNLSAATFVTHNMK